MKSLASTLLVAAVCFLLCSDAVAAPQPTPVENCVLLEKESDYRLYWTVFNASRFGLPAADAHVAFRVTQKKSDTGWSGVAFNMVDNMGGGDFTVMWVAASGKAVVQQRHLPATSGP